MKPKYKGASKQEGDRHWYKDTSVYEVEGSCYGIKINGFTEFGYLLKTVWLGLFEDIVKER